MRQGPEIAPRRAQIISRKPSVMLLPGRGNAAAIMLTWRVACWRDTDDTNRCYSDTRAIRWSGRIASSETFQMFIDWPPKRRLLSEWWHETGPRGGAFSTNEDCDCLLGLCRGTIRPVTDVQRSRLETDRASAIMGSPRLSFARLPRSPTHGSCSAFTKLLLARLVFRFKSLVADRSCCHGYTP